MPSPSARGNYWYVNMAGIDNFAVDDENYEKLKAAKLNDVSCVEIVDILGGIQLIDPHFVARIDESTPEIRDGAYLWNKVCDEDYADRRHRLGVFHDIYED